MITNLWVSRWKICPEKSDSYFLWKLTRLWSLDGLISVLFEVTALNVNALLLAITTRTKADLAWLPTCKL